MSHSYLSFYEPESVEVEQGPLDALLSRAEVLRCIAEGREFDLVVFGGGATAVLVAHQAALHGLRVAMFSERAIGLDSSQSSAQQVQQLFRRHPWRICTAYGRIAAFAQTFDAGHLWSLPDQPTLPFFSASSIAAATFSKAMQWSGGLRKLPHFDCGLFAREVGLAARQEGALLVSGVQELFLEPERESGAYRVGFTDRLTGDSCEVRAGGIVVDPGLSSLPCTRLGTAVKRTHSDYNKRLAVTEESGVFFCASGAPWDALWCAREVVSRVLSAGGIVAEKRTKGQRSSRRLAGTYTDQALKTFRSRGRDAQLSHALMNEVVRRWQGRVRYFECLPNGYQAVCAEALRGEVELAIRSDHAATVGEVVEGSLGLDPLLLSPESLGAITAICNEFGIV
jgi:hypothetical protein